MLIPQSYGIGIKDVRTNNFCYCEIGFMNPMHNLHHTK